MNFAIFLIFIALTATCSAFEHQKHLFIPNCPIDAGLIFFPHENDCTKYYTCSFGDVTLVQCPDGLHFNPIIFVCDYPEHAGCEYLSTVSTPEPDTTTSAIETTTSYPETTTGIDCRSSSAYLTRHDNDCTKFYVHIGETPYLAQCGEGKMFNLAAQDCIKMSGSSCP